MANVNKVILVGRLTRDPESRTFTTGGKVVNFGFAVSNRRKNPQSGQWEDYPMFIDCKAFNRGENGKTADLIEQYLKKGHQAFLEGKLDFEQWDDKTTGQKRSKHVLMIDNVQFLEPRQDGINGGGGAPRQNTMSRGPAPASRQPAAPAYYPADGDDEPMPSGNSGGDNDEIPF